MKSPQQQTSQPKLTVGQCAALACLWEATVPKVGNVNRSADFADTTLYDFVTSAVAIGQVLEQAGEQAFGDTVLQCVEATWRLVQANTNLGIVLLLTPLAMLPRDQPVRESLPRILGGLSKDDCEKTYRAIQLARPGGLGSVAEADVFDAPPADLLSAMKLAENRDRIAYQYCHGFVDVFDRVLPWLVESIRPGHGLVEAIIHTQLRLLSEIPDSLIARKCGAEIAQQASQRAREVLEPEVGSPMYLARLADFDFWLRADANRRNPGTTADLLTAGLFLALQHEMIQPPFSFAPHRQAE